MSATQQDIQNLQTNIINMGNNLQANQTNNFNNLQTNMINMGNNLQANQKNNFSNLQKEIDKNSDTLKVHEGLVTKNTADIKTNSININKIENARPVSTDTFIKLDVPLGEAAIEAMNYNSPPGTTGYDPNKTATYNLVKDGRTVKELYEYAKSINPTGKLAIFLESRLITANAFGIGRIYENLEVLRGADKNNVLLPEAGMCFLRPTLRDRYGHLISGTVGQAYVYNFETGESEISSEIQDLPTCQFSIRKQVAAAVLLQIMYDCKYIQGLQFSPFDRISNILENFVADEGSFVLSVEPTNKSDLENYTKGQRNYQGLFSNEIVTAIQKAVGIEWFQNGPTPKSVDLSTLGEGGHEKKIVTIKSEYLNENITFTLQKTSLNNYQYTTVSHALSERTGIRLDLVNILFTNPSFVDDPEVENSFSGVASQLSTLLQQRNGLNAFNQRCRIAVPGATASYGYGITFVLELISYLGSKLYYYKNNNGTLDGYDATTDMLPLSTFFEDYIFDPLEMTNSSLTGSTRANNNVKKLIQHLQGAPSETTPGSASAAESGQKYLIPDLFGLTPRLGVTNYLLSNGKDLTKLQFAIHNRGVGLNGKRALAPGVTKILNSVSYINDSTDVNLVYDLTDWNNPPTNTNFAALATRLVPGGTYMNAPGTAIIGHEIPPGIEQMPWDSQPTRYQIKFGYGEQLTITMIDYGIYIHVDHSFQNYDYTFGISTDTIGIDKLNDNYVLYNIQEVFRAIVPPELLDSQLLA